MEKLMSSVMPASQFIEDFQFPGAFSADSLRSALNYKPRPDDLFIASYPKTGTTWTQHILLLIFSHGEPMTDTMKFYSAAPFLEMTGAEGAENMPRPGAIKVHLPYHLTPRSDTAKYIYITRNPMDTCVSYFYHMKNMPGHGFKGTFDQFFEFFISGNIDFGDYFDHVLGWYSHRNDPNVLFMTYEEMKEHPKESILKMASFIDDKLYADPLRNDPTKLQNILKYSSFDYMKEVVNKSVDELLSMSKEDVEMSELPARFKEFFGNLSDPPQNSQNSTFIRKGVIGDWKNHFNEEQIMRMKKNFEKRMKDTEFPSLWRSYMQ